MKGLVVALGCAVLAAGCSSIGGVTGAVVGAVSGSATASPAVGIAVGIGVQAAVDEGIKTVLRNWSREEQLQMAALVGTMGVGQTQPWEIRHSVPYGNESGEVTVVRAFDSPLASCKEAVFSVEDADRKKAQLPQPLYITSFCQGTDGWRWAHAEPAVDRWGALQ